MDAHQNVRLGQIASAEGAKLALLKARSTSMTRRSEERCKITQWGLRRSRRNRSDFEHFMPKLGTFWDLVKLRFFNNQTKKIID